MHDREDASSRPRSTALALALTSVSTAVLGLGAPTAAEARKYASGMDRTERKVMRSINRARASHGLGRLHRSRSLSRSADYHTRDMLRGNFFGHGSSNGTPFDARVRRFSRRRARIGENIAWVSHQANERGIAQRIVSMWLRSPGHRAMMLAPGFRAIGVSRRAGNLGSVHALVFTADFASAR